MVTRYGKKERYATVTDELFNMFLYNYLINQGLHPQLGTPHAKFTNYSFDVTEFMRLLARLTDTTRERKKNYLTLI